MLVYITECHMTLYVTLTKKVLPLRKARALVGLPACANSIIARIMKQMRYDRCIISTVSRIDKKKNSKAKRAKLF